MAKTSHIVVTDTPEILAVLKDVEIITAPHLKPNIMRMIKSGAYEKQEIEIGLANLQPGDQIMEMGTGAGIVSSVFSNRICAKWCLRRQRLIKKI